MRQLPHYNIDLADINKLMKSFKSSRITVSMKIFPQDVTDEAREDEFNGSDDDHCTDIDENSNESK